MSGLPERLRKLLAYITWRGLHGPADYSEEIAALNEAIAALDRQAHWPELPMHADELKADDEPGYTADQMRAYASEAMEAARVDAERYRWLRTCTLEEWRRLNHYTVDALDAAIDKARATPSGEQT